MADEGEQIAEVHTESSGSAGKWILLILAVIYVAGSLYFLFDLRGRLDQLGKDETASNAQIAERQLLICHSISPDAQPEASVTGGAASLLTQG